jgi:CPA1 family monovalent cation:H+ antiporter
MSLWRLIAAGAAFSILVTALRLIWVTPGARISFAVRHRFLRQADPRPSFRELLVVGWSGMRGVVSLAAAFALPMAIVGGRPFPERDLIVFLAFSVVVFTLVVQTLTLPPLIRLLRITGSAGLRCEEHDARRIAVNAALDHLERERLKDRSEFAGLYDDLAQHYRDALDTIREGDGMEDPRSLYHERYRTLTRDLLDVQRRTILGLRNDGRINDEVYRRLERSLDLAVVRLREDD